MGDDTRLLNIFRKQFSWANTSQALLLEMNSDLCTLIFKPNSSVILFRFLYMFDFTSRRAQEQNKPKTPVPWNILEKFQANTVFAN